MSVDSKKKITNAHIIFDITFELLHSKGNIVRKICVATENN